MYITFSVPADKLNNHTKIINTTDRLNIAFILDCTSSTISYQAGFNCSCFHISESNAKAFYRLISVNCNCPCYKARPKLQFGVRIIFTLICLGLRSAAIYLYKSISVLNLLLFLGMYQHQILWFLRIWGLVLVF